jgi:hypothetical protein
VFVVVMRLVVVGVGMGREYAQRSSVSQNAMHDAMGPSGLVLAISDDPALSETH